MPRGGHPRLLQCILGIRRIPELPGRPADVAGEFLTKVCPELAGLAAQSGDLVVALPL
jgi:hypothetical protein